LANDLDAARAVFALEGADNVTERMDDLLVFMQSERFSKLRRQIGIAIQ
jgi:hypothetical protein